MTSILTSWVKQRRLYQHNCQLKIITNHLKSSRETEFRQKGHHAHTELHAEKQCEHHNTAVIPIRLIQLLLTSFFYRLQSNMVQKWTEGQSSLKSCVSKAVFSPAWS